MISSRATKAVHTTPLVILLFLVMAKSSLAETFSIVVLPDTQYYSVFNPGIFDAQTAWIVANRAAENIIYVAHMGDIVDGTGCNSGAAEWTNVSNSMAALEAAPAIPYGVMPGNHDFDPLPPTTNCSNNRTQYNATFGRDRFSGEPFYGESQDFTNDGDDTNDTNDNNYTLFSSAGGVDFIAINLAYSFLPGALETDVIAWADDLLQTNPDRIGIITSHFLVSDGLGSVNCPAGQQFGTYGLALWNALRDNPNLAFMLGGHCLGERWITFEGGSSDRPGCLGDVHALLSNYQEYPPGNSSGYMRIMRFDTANWTLEVDTISEEPVPASTTVTIPDDSDQMDNDSVSNFSLDYNAFVNQCVDVALTMDRSGSMNAQSAAIAPASKLVALQNAANLFIDQIALDGRHRLVMEQWNTASVAWTSADTTFDTLTPVNTGNAPLASGISGMIASMSAGGATNIVGGVNAAVSDLVSGAGGPNGRRVVVLFTDGQHNTPFLTNPDLITALHAEINPVGADLELYSIGFGTSINNGPLNTVTGDNDGWHVTEVDPLIVGKNFSVVAAHVMGDQTLSDPVFVLKPGETRSHRFGVSRSDTNITISVNWDLFDPNRIRTKVVPPGGGSCSISSGATVPRTQQTSGTNYRLIRVNLPFPCSGADAHEGEWEVQLTASEEIRTPERVNVLAFASTPIKLSARVDLTAGRLNIAAFLDGAQLKDATFTAYLMPPLPETRDSTRLDELGSTPEGAASIPPLALIPRTAIAVPLTVTGRTAESISAEGTFVPAKKGLYQVRVVADVVDGDGSNLTREATNSFYSPKAKPFFGFNWKTILVILAVLLLVFVVYRGFTRKAQASSHPDAP